MNEHRLLAIFVMISFLVLTGCAVPTAVEEPAGYSLQKPIYKESAGIGVTLLGTADKGSQGTLVEDPGWREYYLEVVNLGNERVNIDNVKLLNHEGRYVDSASSYDQITVPPSAAAGVAGDVAETAAGIAVGQVVPYGGTILGIFTGAASASAQKAEANANQFFLSRLMKNVELAPKGRVKGSAYLPRLENPSVLVVDYGKNEMTYRVELPLPIDNQ